MLIQNLAVNDVYYSDHWKNYKAVKHAEIHNTLK